MSLPTWRTTPPTPDPSAPIAITGVGVVSAIGLGYREFADSLAAGVTGVEPDDQGRLVAAVPDFRVADHLVAEKTYLDRASEFALAATKLCLDDAGLAELPVPEERRGLVLGTQYGCAATTLAYRDRVRQRGMRAATPLLFTHAFANTPASLVAIDFRLRGYHATCCGYNAGSQALETALVALAAGHADMVAAGGFEAPLPAFLECEEVAVGEPDLFDPFAPDEHTAPLGEGAAMLLLEPLARATARGARVRGLIELTPANEPALVIETMPLGLDQSVWKAASGVHALYGDCRGAGGALAAATGVVAVERQLQPPVRSGDEPLEERWEPLTRAIASVGVGGSRVLITPFG